MLVLISILAMTLAAVPAQPDPLKEIWLTNIYAPVITSVITSVVAALVTWFFARRKNRAEASKYQAEADSNELDNVEKAIKIWRESADNMAKHNEELRQKMDKVVEQNENLAEQNNNLIEVNKRLEKKLTQLERDYKNLLKNYNELKEKFN